MLSLAVGIVVCGAAVALGALGLTGALHRAGPAATAAPQGTAYFVDCARTSTGAGTRAAPWADLAAVDAHGAFRPGDRILLRRGSVCIGQLSPSGSGRPGAPITIGAWGAGPRPVVAGGGTADQTGAVQLVDVHDWRIDGIAVSNTAPALDNTYRAGILVLNRSGSDLGGISIEDDDVWNVTSDPWTVSGIEPHAWGGIVVAAYPRADDARSSLHDVRIQGNRVTDVGRTGIVVWDPKWDDHFIEDVRVTGNTVSRAQGDSIILMGVDGGVVDRNVSADGANLPACPLCTPDSTHTASAGIWPTESRNIRISDNEVFGEHAAGGDGEGFDLDLSSSLITFERNYAHDNEGGGLLVCGTVDSVVRYNVLQNDGGGEITFACDTPAQRLVVANNTIVTERGGGTDVVRHAPGSGDVDTRFVNNIVVNRGTGGYDWAPSVVSSDNTFDGYHPPSEPAGDGTLRDQGDLLAPGSGGAGLDSLGGYRLRPGASAWGSGAPGFGTAPDLFGGVVNGRDPNRGAQAGR